MTSTPIPARRYLLRLAVAVVALLAVDRFVPGLLARAESARYESDQLFRFEVSDLFTLGPLVGYLHEHPRGARPRVAFFGDSIIWGYWLSASQTVPAEFQRFDPAVRVLNFGVNGFETPSSYLIAKDAIDTLDALYVLDIGGAANPRLPEMVTVAPEDVARFHLQPPDSVETGLERALAPWHFYSDAYRIQAALFGTSTRLYLYLHKGEIARRALGRAVAENPPPALTDLDQAVATIRTDRPRASAMPSDVRQQSLAAQHPLLFEYATLARDHRKRLVFVELVGHSPAVSDDDRADLNRLFFPYVCFLKLEVPQALRIDGLHFSPIGAAAVARVLRRDAPPLIPAEQP